MVTLWNPMVTLWNPMVTLWEPYGSRNQHNRSSLYGSCCICSVSLWNPPHPSPPMMMMGGQFQGDTQSIPAFAFPMTCVSFASIYFNKYM